ncbi:MAG: hypothetical protein IJ849_12025 [Selenomonadaceae bacterium]|nr:hypothetical protein [Selenomonadaceae bacterium]
MRKQLKIKLAVAAGAVVILAALGVAWYFLFYTKTPEYALKKIDQALVEHDLPLYNRYVALDKVLDSAYEPFMDALMDAEDTLTPEAKNSVGDFMQLMKAPVKSSLKEAVAEYVATGAWESDTEDSPTEDAQPIVTRSGLKTTQFKSLDSVESRENEAVAKVTVYQQEAKADFVLDVILRKAENGDWQVTEIGNLKDFVAFLTKARMSEITEYASASAAIAEKHNQTMREAEFRRQMILTQGSLGNDETRVALKGIMEDTIKADWETRRAELNALTVPAGAVTLQHLRLRICDLHIEYAAGYAAWLTDKKAATLKAAEAKLKQAQTLEQEESFLAKRITGK